MHLQQGHTCGKNVIQLIAQQGAMLNNWLIHCWDSFSTMEKRCYDFKRDLQRWQWLSKRQVSPKLCKLGFLQWIPRGQPGGCVSCTLTVYIMLCTKHSMKVVNVLRAFANCVPGMETLNRTREIHRVRMNNSQHVKWQWIISNDCSLRWVQYRGSTWSDCISIFYQWSHRIYL